MMHCDLLLRWRFRISHFYRKHFPSSIYSLLLKCNVKVVVGKHHVGAKHRWFYLETGRMPFAIHTPSIFQNRVRLCQKQTRTTHVLARKVASLLETLIFFFFLHKSRKDAIYCIASERQSPGVQPDWWRLSCYFTVLVKPRLSNICTMVVKFWKSVDCDLQICNRGTFLYVRLVHMTCDWSYKVSLCANVGPKTQEEN